MPLRQRGDPNSTFSSFILNLLLWGQPNQSLPFWICVTFHGSCHFPGKKKRKKEEECVMRKKLNHFWETEGPTLAFWSALGKLYIHSFRVLHGEGIFSTCSSWESFYVESRLPYRRPYFTYKSLSNCMVEVFNKKKRVN